MKIGILIIAHCGIGPADFYQYLGPIHDNDEVIFLVSFQEKETRSTEEIIESFGITRPHHEEFIIPIEILERLQKIEEASSHPPDHCAQWQCQFRQRDKMVLKKLRLSLRPP